MEGVYKMKKKICINKFFKDARKRDIIDNYIVSFYSYDKQFRLNNKRRLWHIRNDGNLYRWAEREGVRI